MAVDVLSDEPFMQAHLAGLGPFYGTRCDALAAALQAEPVTGSASTCRTAACSCGCGCKDRPPQRATCPGRWKCVAFVPGEASTWTAPAPTASASFATLTPEELGEAAARLARALD